jgi:uncharacterized protein YjbJ (UPF0337 family)
MNFHQKLFNGNQLQRNPNADRRVD